LPVETVDDVGARLDKRCLEHVRQQREDGVQRSKVLLLTNLAVLNTSKKFSKNGQVQNKWGSKKRILAFVEDVDSRPATTEDLGIVLVNRALRVPNSRNIFNDDNMIRMFPLSNSNALRADFGGLEEETVCINHVVNDATLANLLTLELPLSRQVTTIIVTEVVVRSNGEGFDTGVNEELGENGLQLGLARLEIITTNERLVAFSQFNSSRNECVLWGTVDEGFILEDSSDGEHSRRRNFGMRILNRVQEVISSVIDTGNDLTVTFGVGSPKNDDAIKIVVRFEPADIGTNALEVSLFVITRDKVISPCFLISGNIIGVVNGRERLAEECHVGSNLTLEVIV
jgi:hypothetical protein